MLIANSMYDAVFKYLLEDAESTRVIVGTMLDEEIKEIELVPQEASVRVLLAEDAGPTDFTLRRIDLAATVLTAAGERLRVLIEVQMSHYSEDLLRFRRYLGQRASESSSYVTVCEEDGEPCRARPLLAIYFLGHGLPEAEATVLKVVCRYDDAVAGEQPSLGTDFVDALTRDRYVVQVPRLTYERRNDLERLLSVFDQRLRTEDRHILEVDHVEIPLAYAPVLRRLQFAALNASVVESMVLADELIGEWTAMRRDLAERDEILAEQERIFAEQERTFAEQEQALAERDETIRRLQAEVEALRRRVTGAA